MFLLGELQNFPGKLIVGHHVVKSYTQLQSRICATHIVGVMDNGYIYISINIHYLHGIHSNIFSLLRGSQIAPNSMGKKLIWGWYRNTCLLQTRGTAHVQPRIMYGWLCFDLLYKQNTDLAMTPLILGEGPDLFLGKWALRKLSNLPPATAATASHSQRYHPTCKAVTTVATCLSI